MDEAVLREMLERAAAVEPPIGPIARNAVRAGIQRRRRRRVAGAAAILAVAAAVVLTVPAVTGIRSIPVPATGTIPATVWVANTGGQEWVTPISTTTNQAGRPIGLGRSIGGVAEAATPNGKMVYVVTLSTNRVTPISTATNTAGKPIKVGKEPDAIAITPDGRTAYVASSGTVTPIATATNTASQPVTINPVAGYNVAASPAITPDGKTIYVSPESPK